MRYLMSLYDCGWLASFHIANKIPITDAIKRIPSSSITKVLLPFNHTFDNSEYWSLVVVTPTSATWTLLDPIGIIGEEIKALCDLHKAMKDLFEHWASLLGIKAWEFSSTTFPRRQDRHKSGIYIIEAGRAIQCGEDINKQQEDIRVAEKRLEYYTYLEHRISIASKSISHDSIPVPSTASKSISNDSTPVPSASSKSISHNSIPVP
ncbi:hypothetical protein N431DRAFT_457670 [Stipitochalara longipes BDJ]|nr:hypothetical protein N431DRAFT_457670 [Stipitochalara longipes BDJ]